MGALLQVLLGTVLTSTGTVELYSDEAMCVAPAHGAQWVSTDGKIKIPGCWTSDGEKVFVSWFDADVGRFPVSVVKKAEAL